MQSFMKASRDLKSKDLPISNTVIVMGPSKSGKSFFIKKSLNAFYRNTPANNRLIIHIDLSSYRILNFDSFRNRFESAVVDQIAEGVSDSQAPIYMNAMKDTLSLHFDKSMLDILINQTLARLINDLSHMDISIECRKTLMDMYHTMFDGNDSLGDSYANICTIAEHVARDMRCRHFDVVLMIVREICYEKDIMDNHSDDMLQPSGVEFVEVFFDMLNYVAGYHALNNFEQNQHNLGKFIDVVMAIGKIMLL